MNIGKYMHAYNHYSDQGKEYFQPLGKIPSWPFLVNPPPQKKECPHV